jgi:hypothetical protein
MILSTKVILFSLFLSMSNFHCLRNVFFHCFEVKHLPFLYSFVLELRLNGCLLYACCNIKNSTLFVPFKAKASRSCMDYSFHMAITNWSNKVGAASMCWLPKIGWTSMKLCILCQL